MKTYFDRMPEFARAALAHKHNDFHCVYDALLHHSNRKTGLYTGNGPALRKWILRQRAIEIGADRLAYILKRLVEWGLILRDSKANTSARRLVVQLKQRITDNMLQLATRVQTFWASFKSARQRRQEQRAERKRIAESFTESCAGENAKTTESSTDFPKKVSHELKETEDLHTKCRRMLRNGHKKCLYAGAWYWTRTEQPIQTAA